MMIILVKSVYFVDFLTEMQISIWKFTKHVSATGFDGGDVWFAQFAALAGLLC